MSNSPTHTSNAEWPDRTMFGSEQITTDRHYSKKEAAAEGELLRKNGFGGDRKVFPLRTWVEPIKEGAK